MQNYPIIPIPGFVFGIFMLPQEPAVFHLRQIDMSVRG